jgi:flagellar motor protein MotB
MTTKIARPLVRLAVLAVLAAGTAGCSTMADLDPTGLIGGDSSPSPSDQFPADANAAPAPDDATTTPDLASLPARPDTASTAAQQQQVAQNVTSSGAQAQSGADALRAGTEAAAPAPAAAQAPVQMAAAPSAPPTTNDAPPSASDAPPSASDAPPSAAAPIASAPSAAPAARRMGVASAEPAVGPPQPRRVGAEPSAADQAAAAAMAAGPAPTPPPSAMASAAPAPDTSGGAAVPAVPASGAMAGSRAAMLTPPVVTDAQLGFQRSSAPPLDPSISNWVSAPILAHYRQTASLAGSAGTSSAAVPAVAVKGARPMGGPDMSGAVVANMDALSGTAAGAIAANYGGVPPTAVVFFPGDGTSLSPAARGQVRSAVAAFKAGGSVASIRVIGHASSRTGNMPVERHLETIFEKSQKRANVVAQELIHQGVPADKVNIEAVGDSQPIYYESMPKGEDGNRRAEIFVQG